METITTNTKTLELNGEEVHVHFTSGFPYFWLRNDGSYTVQMSLSPNISEGKDGVIEVPAGSSAGTMHGFNDTRNDLYLLGKGKVQVMGTYTPENPFRKARKGGGENAGSNILPHSEGLAAYFDHSQNVTDISWTDIVGGVTMTGEVIPSDEYIGIGAKGLTLPTVLNSSYTMYTIVRSTQSIKDDHWFGLLTNNINTFGLFADMGKLGVYKAPPESNPLNYTSDVSAKEWHICTLSCDNGWGLFYIDGILKFVRAVDFSALVSNPYFLTFVGEYKLLAVINGVAHGTNYVRDNTMYLAEKYGIEI